MARVPASATQGKALFEQTQPFYYHDDAGDSKDPGGVYSHIEREGSATEAESWCDFNRYVGYLLKGMTLVGIGDKYGIRWDAGAAAWVIERLPYATIQQVSATDKILGRVTAGAGTIEEITCTAAGRAILDDATAADQRTTLGAAASGLATASGLTISATDKILGRVTAGSGAVEEVACTAAGRAILDDADAATQRNTLGFDDSLSTLIRVPKWVKFTKTHTNFQAAALTNSIELFSLPAGAIIHAVKIKHSVAFAGGAIASYTVEVGIAGTLAKYASAFDVFQAVSGTAFFITGIIGSEDHGAATSIKATATSTVANLDQSTAGSVDVWVLLSVAV